MTSIPICPDCDGIMNEISDWWFKCRDCGKEYDGELVEWSGEPGEITLDVVECPKCGSIATYNENDRSITCLKCGTTKVN